MKPNKQAFEWNERGRELMEADDSAAIEAFEKAIALDPQYSSPYYNVGLIYKYRSDWQQSLKFNQLAMQHDSDDQAPLWNAAIAATALKDWKLVREIWEKCGFEISGESGEIHDNFGMTPVRLHPDGEAEVVWAQRVCPVRARILSIPLRDTGHRYGDLVLHDGAAVGFRTLEGTERPVFNVLETIECSLFETHVCEVTNATEDELKQLNELLYDRVQGVLEIWSSSIRVLCKKCSEGIPHENCDEPSPSETSDATKTRVAFALKSPEDLQLLDEWAPTCKDKVQYGLA